MSDPATVKLPAWAEEMRQVFRAGATSQFVLHRNVFDLARAPDGKGGTDFVSLADFLSGTMFQPFDVVIRYDRGRGVRIEPPDPKRTDAYKPVEEVLRFLKGIDAFRREPATSDAALDKLERLDLRDQLPRDPKRALEIVDRVLAFARRRAKVQDGKVVGSPLKVAVVLDYAHFIAPQGDPIYVADLSQTLIQVQDWAANPDITGSFVVTVLITENLADLNRSLVETPYSAKIRIPLPDAGEIHAFVADLVPDEAEFAKASEVTRGILADKLLGLSRVAVRTLVKRALTSGERITGPYLTRTRKELLEMEAAGRLELLESERTLDYVVGHAEAKVWLREDALLFRHRGRSAIPRGYLLTGRRGVGKKLLTECFAAELGVACVELKLARHRWLAGGDRDAEKLFATIRAVGSTVVFVDDAIGDRGRDGESVFSSRLLELIAEQISDPGNRGGTIWMFATSRPDHLEIELESVGRLEESIPLFPPQDAYSRATLFAAIAQKLGIKAGASELPPLPESDAIGAREMERVLSCALRDYHVGRVAEKGGGAKGTPLRACIESAIAAIRSSASAERLELMDLLAVQRCSNSRLLPDRFRSLPTGELHARIACLKDTVGD